MKKKLFIFLTIIAAIVVLLGFFTIRYIVEANEISKLQLTIKDVQIQELKLTYTKLKINIEILNPTNQDLSSLLIDYKIFISDIIVGNGSIALTNIPAQTNKETSTIVTINFIDVANAVIDAIKKQNFDLTIQGTLHVKILYDLFSISHKFSYLYHYI